MKNLESKKFSVFYDAEGSELESHRIDARQLGESILGMSEVISQADKIINGETSTIQLLVEGPKAGSLGIQFEAIELAEAGLNVLRLIGILGVGQAISSVISLVKQIDDKPILEIEKKQNSTTSKIILKDGGEIEAPTKIAELVADATIRRGLNKIISKPLEGKIKPVFKIVSDDNVVEHLTNEQTQAFQPLPRGSLIETETYMEDRDVKFDQVNFNKKTGWKIIYDGLPKAVRIEDETFLEKVNENRAAFSKEDLFSVRLEVSRKVNKGKVSKSLVLKEVLRHRAAKERKLV